MLKKRSRASSSKKGLMSDYPFLPSPRARRYGIPTTSIYPSPRLLLRAPIKGSIDSEAVKSPTSPLEPKPFAIDGSSSKAGSSWEKKRQRHWQIGGSGGPVGLGIVDALMEEKRDLSTLKQDNRRVLFSSPLKIQIPSLLGAASPIRSIESPTTPIEFGIKTMNNVLGWKSPCGRNSPSKNLNGGAFDSPRVCTGAIPASQMEQSEDYTCVITHGPNPRTTHIFENCIVENCGVHQVQTSCAMTMYTDRPRYPSEDFLSFCHTCKKDLRQGKDIYIYRGEKAFCCCECRYREILFEEETHKCLGDSL